MRIADANRAGMSVRDLAAIVFRRKWSIAVIFVTGLVATVVWLWVVREDMYELTAKVLVKIGYEQAPSNTILSDRPLNVIGQRAQDVNSEIDILQNTELLSRVVARLGLDQPPPEPPYPDGLFARGRWRAKRVAKRVREIVDETLIVAGLRPRLSNREKVLSTLRTGLRVVPQKDSNVFIAQMLLPVREGASAVLNTLLDEYLAFRLQLWKASGAVAFFESQVADTGRDLRSAEDALNTFENNFDINIMSRQQDVLLLAISEAERAKRDAELALVDARAKWARLDKELATDNPSFAVSGEFGTGSFPEQLMVQLSTLQREREKLRMTELDDGVRLQNMKSQIDVVLAQIRDYVKSIEAEKQAAFETRADAVAKLRAELHSLHAQESEWNALKRRAKVSEDAYLMYRGRLNEANGMEALESRRIGNVVIVERATDALVPYGVRKLTLLGIALALIACVSLAWITIAEFFDHGVYTAATLQEQVDAPVLAVVPTSRTAQLRRLSRRTPTFESIG